ncbi:ABC transporter ATP-binding protein [Catenulispora sp. NF23]|uniref:ABC transporter ATP-binding protein n=1 Tax=Catenulispora pinistramenti TaxID=2705254 RepID=A0ABS5L6R8_9ACTN|nr:ABC transporter ATP-binding protein [Catenulispora pinistramenti]MBS2538788.1 ABC transporter ATP-binding protein [Catenulispora pinistramenti]MBS2554031.1 ABC transporter ATP-binding protein [Catenulispora pinistramenti]
MTAPAAPSPHLTARGVVRRFGGVIAVDGVDLSVPPARITALVGPNGAGKSTLFDCLSGTLRPDAGRVLLGGRDIAHLPDYRRARLGLARTFQQLAIFPGLTVAENVRIGAEGRPGGTLRGLVGLPDPARGQTALATDRALRLAGLAALRDHPVADLPTGTLRMVELARALAGAPRVLLLDEPAAGLDATEATRLAAVLRALSAEGMALLLVEHDVDLVAELADVVYVMAAGRVVARGPAAAVLADPEVGALWSRGRAQP